MKNQIIAVVIGLIFVNTSFAQTRASYKQQFSKSEGVQYCSNFTKSASVVQNYKHAANVHFAYSSESVSIAKCQDNPCSHSNKPCDGKVCHVQSNVSSNYKHPYYGGNYKARDCATIN